MATEWINYVKRIQAIAQNGLTYSENGYDQERYEELRDISVSMMSRLSGIDPTEMKARFASETGYQTPKVDVRGVVFQNGRILMVKETIDGLWALPGGWADVGFTPKEVAAKEVWEETGFRVNPIRLLAVMDKKKHPHPPDLYHIYKLFILCKIKGGEKNTGIETSDVDFFDRDNLPPLSEPRNTYSQIQTMFAFYDDPAKELICD